MENMYIETFYEIKEPFRAELKRKLWTQYIFYTSYPKYSYYLIYES